MLSEQLSREKVNRLSRQLSTISEAVCGILASPPATLHPEPHSFAAARLLKKSLSISIHRSFMSPAAFPRKPVVDVVRVSERRNPVLHAPVVRALDGFVSLTGTRTRSTPR